MNNPSFAMSARLDPIRCHPERSESAQDDSVFLIILVSIAIVVAPMTHRASAEPAKSSPPPVASGQVSRFSYESFRLLHTRNVFDPDRRPVRPVGNTTSAPVTRADYAALTGTLLSVDKSYAFFSGSRPEFNRVLGVQGKIANATIAGITGQSIEIERNGKRMTVAIGQTVPFDNETAPGTPPADVSAIVSSTDGASPAGTPPSAAYRPATGAAAVSSAPKGPPSNIDEIRRRMMEKRQQELK